MNTRDFTDLIVVLAILRIVVLILVTIVVVKDYWSVTNGLLLYIAWLT